MAKPDDLARLKDSVAEWNAWRLAHPDVVPEFSGADLSGADLRGANLGGADLRGAYLSDANLMDAYLTGAYLSGADLSGAILIDANLCRADFSGGEHSDCIVADLSGAGDNGYIAAEAPDFIGAVLSGADLMDADCGAVSLGGADLSGTDLRRAKLRAANLVGTDLSGADLGRADLSGADLCGADLSRASCVGTILRAANITACRVYGISAWDVDLEGAIQSDLIITPPDSPTIRVDSLDIAQFIYLLLNNERIRHVIDTITSKVVLILGRFTPERKPVLDAIREKLRKRDYLPVLFDFDKPSNRDITETVSTLAHMARFVIADITDAKSIPQELMRIVPALPSVPVQPLLLASQREYGMFEHFGRYPWVLEPYLYEDEDGLLAAVTDKVIGPAEAKAREQTGK